MKTLALASLIVLAGCSQIREIRTATIDVGLNAYRSEACALGPAGDLVRSEQRADVYASTGVYVEADCLFKEGDTIDDYLERKSDS